MKKALIAFMELGTRAQAALSLSLLWLLALAIVGFVHTVEIWITVFGFGLILALIIFGVKFYLQRQRLAKAETYRNGAADFLFSFLRKYAACAPVHFMPVQDGNELRRIAELSMNKGVISVNFRLLLAAGNSREDVSRLSCLVEWLLHYAKGYGIENNFAGRGGFPLYYTSYCGFSGQHLEIKIIIMESGEAVKYIKNPPQPKKSIDIFVDDDDFGYESEDDIPEDWKVKTSEEESQDIALDDDFL